MTINVLYVLWQLIEILRKDIRSTTYRDSEGMKTVDEGLNRYRLNLPALIDNQKQAVWDSKSISSSAWKVLKLVAPMISCLLDSIFDGVYFIKLKTAARIIHVPAWVHVVQGLLLYTG